MKPREINELLSYLTPDEQAEVDALIAHDAATVVWRPLPGPQTMAYESKADVIGFGGAAGGGKGLSLNTPLPTPTGWTTIGQVQPGDILFDEGGNQCVVSAVSQVQSRACFRLTFDDGATLVADDVHRWVTLDAKELSALTRHDPEWRAARRAKRPSRAKSTTSPARLAALAKHNTIPRGLQSPPAGTLRDTQALHNTLLAPSGRRNHAIRVQGCLQLADVALPVPPYTLGAWLGDGSSRNGQLTGEDAYVWGRIEAEGFVVKHYAWSDIAHNILGLKVKLRDLGVLENKHIPQTYLRAGQAQRLALLQGLMDTDGHAALDGGCEFDNTNETLANEVLELVGTLGIKATLQRGTARLAGKAIGPKWRVKFTTSLPVFGMPRKAVRINATTRRVSCLRYLVACDPVASVPTRCIAVDSPSRQYLAGLAMVPTHNTDLACGKGLTQHERIAVFRREGTELTGVIDRLTELIGNRDGYNGKDRIWRWPGKQFEFCSVPNLGDEKKYQGRPKDLLVLDEASNFLEAQVRFLMGWVRSTTPGQKCQTLMCFNPPTSSEGRWIVKFFAPWIDKRFAGPRAAPGELHYVGVVPGENGVSRDVWFGATNPGPFVIIDGEPVFEFDPLDYEQQEIVTPQSRTFIPSRISDNPYLSGTGYMTVLQSLPEPLRSQMLFGSFEAGMTDDPWQVVPTSWVERAMLRWKDRSPKGLMSSLGVDVARGGKDSTVLSPRHGQWYDRLTSIPGKETPSGQTVVGQVIAIRRNAAPVHIDVIGVGASPYDLLREAKVQVIGVNVAEASTSTDKSGRLRFANQRSELWWRIREALDPENDTGIELPPDPELLADLCAPLWSLQGLKVQVESREDIVKRIGRSPDKASALILAQLDTPNLAAIKHAQKHTNTAVMDYDPLAGF